jgi:uncharacterized protein (UPF0179 family)
MASNLRADGQERELPADTVIYRSSQDDCKSCSIKDRCCPQYTDSQGRTQHLRDLTRSCPLDCDHAAVRSIQARSQEGGNALRSPQNAS